MRTLGAIFGAFVSAALVAIGFVLGVAVCLDWIFENCQPGAHFMHKGEEYVCRVSVVRKGEH